MRVLWPLAGFLTRRWYRPTSHHTDRVPASGPVIFASNHQGLIDGPLLAICAPRPVHVLTKQEMFSGPLGAFLSAAGQIPLERGVVDPSALRQSVAVLTHGGAVGIFPEGTRGAGDLRRSRGGAAYLALVSGAPVVPVTMLGTRAPGTGNNYIPPRGGRFDLVYGRTYRTEAVPWPRTRSETDRVRRDLHRHMQACLAEALELTSGTLPGPLAGEGPDEPPPAPGALPDQGAAG